MCHLGASALIGSVIDDIVIIGVDGIGHKCDVTVLCNGLGWKAGAQYGGTFDASFVILPTGFVHADLTATHNFAEQEV